MPPSDGCSRSRRRARKSSSRQPPSATGSRSQKEPWPPSGVYWTPSKWARPFRTEPVRLLRGGGRPGARERPGATQLHVGRALEGPAFPDPDLQGRLALFVELHRPLAREGRRPDDPPALPDETLLDRQDEASRLELARVHEPGRPDG